MEAFSRVFTLTAAAVVVAILLSSTAFGEKTRTGEQVLSLPEILQMAFDHSPELAATRSETAAARSDLAQVKAAYYPQVDVTAVAGPVNDAKTPVIRDNRITDPSPGLSLSSIGIFGRLDMTLTQPLYTFGKLSNREEAALHGVKATQLEAAKTKAEIALRVKRLYYALILARQGVAAAKDADGFFSDARKRISRLLQLGADNVSESDLYRIDAYQADTLRSRAQAEEGMKVTYFALKALLGLAPKEDFRPAETTLGLGSRKLADLDSYIRQALKKRPEVRQLNQALLAGHAQVEAARSDRYPSIFAALRGSVAGAPGRDHLDNPYIPDEFNHAYAGVAVGLQWNLDFGIGRARVEEKEAKYNALMSTKQNAEMSIPIQVAQDYRALQEWRKSAEAYHKAVIASRKWVVSAMTSFDMGVGNAADMLNGIEKYGHNQEGYLQALFNYNMSLARLDYAVGLSGRHSTTAE